MLVGKLLRGDKRHRFPCLPAPWSSLIYNTLLALLWKANSNLFKLCFMFSWFSYASFFHTRDMFLPSLLPFLFFFLLLFAKSALSLPAQLYPTLLSCSVPSFKSSSHLNQQFPSLCKNTFIFPRPSVPYPSGLLYLWDHCPLHGISHQNPTFHALFLSFNCLFHSTVYIFLSPSLSPCESTFKNPPYKTVSFSFLPFCLQHASTSTNVHIFLGFRKQIGDG